MTATETIASVDTWLAAWRRVQTSHAVVDAQYATRGRCTREALREMTRATKAFSAACKAWGR
jgi:P2-related tail formation protein